MYDCGDSQNSNDNSSLNISTRVPQASFNTANSTFHSSLKKETLLHMESPSKSDNMNKECEKTDDSMGDYNFASLLSKAEGDAMTEETADDSCASNLMYPVDVSDMGRYISEDKPSASVNIPTNISTENFVSDSGAYNVLQHGSDPLETVDVQMNDPSLLLDGSKMEIVYPGANCSNVSSSEASFQLENEGPKPTEDADNNWSKCKDAASGPVGNEDEQCGNNLELHPYTGGLTLDELDDDVLFLIASFLEARVVHFALIHVCKRFQVMFDNEAYWKARINVRWPKKYPAVPGPPNFHWVDACVGREDSYRVWTDVENNTRHFMYACNVFGEVDAVHLMKEGQLVVSGDRNRSLNFIDLGKYPGPEGDETQKKEMLVHTNTNIHGGWIWSIASNRNHVITGCWDTRIRLFDVRDGCKLVSHFRCRSPVLSLYTEDNEIVASCFDKKIYFIDCRTKEVKSRLFHTKPVLCVTGNDKYIISGSEDKSICVFDRRASKIFKMLKLDNYPLCMSYIDNQLWFGDKTGTLHLHDGTDGVFQHVGSYDVGHTEKMTGVISTRGAIFTCSGDKSVKVLHPTQEPDPITSLYVHKKEIANIDYKNGVLVSAGGDDCIGVWLPKHWERNTHLL